MARANRSHTKSGTASAATEMKCRLEAPFLRRMRARRGRPKAVARSADGQPGPTPDLAVASEPPAGFGHSTARSVASASSEGLIERLLRRLSYLAQIAAVGVAIYAYIYTVIPVYQKERLAEQAAEYEGIVKKQTPKLAELDRQVADARANLQKLSVERERLSGDLKEVERKLSLARDEKRRVENQIQYMTYRWRLPDGTPATTPEQVKIARDDEARRNFESEARFSCTMNRYRGAFSSIYVKVDRASKFYPFSEAEIVAWKQHGSKYPLRSAMECVDAITSEYEKKGRRAAIEGPRAELIRQINSAAATPWKPPVDPLAVIEELSPKLRGIEKERLEEVKKVEEEHAERENIWFDPDGSRRALVEHNYKVGKWNAEAKAKNSKFNAEYEAENRANAMRKSINEEIERLFGRKR